MLEVQNFGKSSGTLQALEGLGLRVQPGEIFGFVGLNGADKTAAMRIMLGVLSTDSGRVSWNGKEVDDDVRCKAGYMLEERGLCPRMQVGRQLEHFARLHGLGKTKATWATGQQTDRLRVTGRRNDSMQKLSLGNQQRVQLAATLVHDPVILVLDESFSDLDPVAVDVMSQVLKDKAKSGVPVIFSSHQLDLIERLCGRVSIISHSPIVAEGTIHKLRNAGKPQIALAVLADPDRAHTALTSAGVKPQPDPLEGASNTSSADGLTRTIVDAKEIDDQTLLWAALSAGPIREFAPRRPHLADLSKDVVVAAQPEEPTQKGRRGIFDHRKDTAR